jgi:hypothetical protein
MRRMKRLGFAFAERRSIYTALRFRLSSTFAFPLLRCAVASPRAFIRACGSPINAYCRVMITAYYCDALATFVNTNRKRHLLPVAARRHWLRFGRLANNQSIPAINTARDPKLFALSLNRAGEPDATGADTRNRKFVAFDRARPNLLVLLRESVIAVLALESGESRFLSILNAPKEALESFLHTFKRILLDCPQMAIIHTTTAIKPQQLPNFPRTNSKESAS